MSGRRGDVRAARQGRKPKEQSGEATPHTLSGARLVSMLFMRACARGASVAHHA